MLNDVLRSHLFETEKLDHIDGLKNIDEIFKLGKTNFNQYSTEHICLMFALYIFL